MQLLREWVPPVNVFHRLTMVIGDVGWVYLNLECSAILPTYPAKFANVLSRYLNIFAKETERRCQYFNCTRPANALP